MKVKTAGIKLRNAYGKRRTLVIAHRGGAAEAPENTLAAFRLAWRQQAAGNGSV